MSRSVPFLQDADCTLWHGDVLDVLAGLPAESVDCVVTSPPYWGLRDYGTGAWEGGDEDCDHKNTNWDRSLLNDGAQRDRTTPMKDDCSRCGARRVDSQLGLEPTPDQYVQRMVEVFREVRRVLCAHGTCWVNLGDSYAGSVSAGDKVFGNPEFNINRPSRAATKTAARETPAGLKPKDLVGIPWRVAFALQADGWWLRSDIVWSKPNPMPESVTDRPTKAHEYVFLLTKQPRYWFDQEAVREPAEHPPFSGFRGGGGYVNQNAGTSNSDKSGANTSVRPITAPPQDDTLDGSDGETPRGPDGRRKTTVQGADGSLQHRDGERWPNSGRNVRSVWTIATQPYPEAHFATYPEELVRRCVLAGCPERVCRVCGKASERIVETDAVGERHVSPKDENSDRNDSPSLSSTTRLHNQYFDYRRTDLGWSDCGHDDWRPGVVLDPFVGSGTTCLVARDHGRHSVGIDLNADYLALAATRLQQLSLLTGEAT